MQKIGRMLSRYELGIVYYRIDWARAWLIHCERENLIYGRATKRLLGDTLARGVAWPCVTLAIADIADGLTDKSPLLLSSVASQFACMWVEYSRLHDSLTRPTCRWTALTLAIRLRVQSGLQAGTPNIILIYSEYYFIRYSSTVRKYRHEMQSFSRVHYSSISLLSWPMLCNSCFTAFVMPPRMLQRWGCMYLV